MKVFLLLGLTLVSTEMAIHFKCDCMICMCNILECNVIYAHMYMYLYVHIRSMDHILKYM